MSTATVSHLDEIIAALCEPSLAGMMVTAGAGMGKTSLGTAVATVLGTDYEVMWVTGRRLLAQTPFAVLETFYPQLRPAMADESPSPRMNVVQGLYEYLLSRSAVAGKMTLLVVDDAQWIDQESCAVLEQLAVSGDVRMLLLCQSGTSTVARSALFTDDTMMAQHDLRTLTGDEVLASCERRLGGKIVPGAAAVFAEKSGGHPLFLQVLLDAALADQSLVGHRNIWALATVPADPDPIVSDVALDLFNDCTTAEQAILECVALAEPVPTGVLPRIVAEADYGNLINAGILQRTAGTRDALEFVAPVFSQSLRQRIPVGRSIDIRKRVLNARSVRPLNSDALMRHAGWSIDCGQYVAARRLLHATRIANLRNKSRLALRLAATVSDPKYVFAARMESVLAHTKLSQFAHCWAQIEVLLTQCKNPSEFDAVASLAAMVAVKEGQPAATLHQLARTWRDAYQGYGLESCSGADLVDALAVVDAGYFLPAATRSRLRDIALTPGRVGLQFTAAVLLAHSEAVEGNYAAARADFTKAKMLLWQNPGRLGLFRPALFAQHIVFLASIGESTHAADLLGGYSRDRAADRQALDLGGITELIEAMEELRAGNVVSAVAAFDVAIAGLVESDPVRVLPYALAAAAYACHLMGGKDRAAALVQEFTDQAPETSAPIWLLSKAYIAATTSEEATASIVATLKDLCDEARRHGAPAVELAILDVLLRAGCTDRVQRTAEASAAIGGPTAAMVHAVARGLLDEDPDALADIAAMPGARLNKMLAAEALSYALRIHHKRGNSSGKASVLGQLRQLHFPFQATGSPAIVELAASAELTVREREIATLVHGRYSNRDIAEKFTLSQRTIEGHLYKIYAKLGVGSREELHESWLPEQL